MQYKTIDQKSYKIHTIKTDRFKTSKIEVIFRLPAEKKYIPIDTFLSEVLNESSKKYPTRRALSIKMEELYKAYYSCIASKIGNAYEIIFTISFINPELINEPNFIEEIVKFLFEMITKPSVKNNEFDNSVFKIVKNEILLDIDSINEDPEKKSITNALEVMDKDSASSFSLLGTKEIVEKINPDNLYQEYLRFFNKADVDIFVIGNTNMDNVVSLIKKYYKNHRIRNNKIDFYIDNKLKKKTLIKKDKSVFVQTQLVMIYNLVSLNKNEKEIVFRALNYILGSGGLSSKLYKYIRNDNSYCYGISSMYFKNDNLLCISSSLSKDNVEATIKLVKKSIKEMQKGIFTDEDLINAKNNLLLSLNVNKNNKSFILYNYEFKVLTDSYTFEEKMESLENITKEDIVVLANKIKENTIYVLEEA